MKRILLSLAMLALMVPTARQAAADSDVSIDLFYNNLNDGSWIEVGDYGYCWQPDVAASTADWRPYADGYWVYTDVGWTWVSYEDFGWATYHYGRWARLADVGWVWVPGYEWGPAWVSWRTGGNYVGWAPLPPTGERVYEGRPITGHVDIEFDIGPAYYNFVDLRYIGEPVLRARIVAPTQNITIINNTVNVTNITYNNSTVYNYGPDYNRLSQYSARPIQRLKLERQTNVNFAGGVRSNEIARVQGDKLLIAAPIKIQKPATAVAPTKVKTKIAQTKVEHGWGDISDPKAQAQLREKMKTENAKAILPASIQPNQKRAQVGAAVGASPATGPVIAPDVSRARTPKDMRAKTRLAEHPAATPAEVPVTNGKQEQGSRQLGKDRNAGNKTSGAGAKPANVNPPAPGDEVTHQMKNARQRANRKMPTPPVIGASPSGQSSKTQTHQDPRKLRPAGQNSPQPAVQGADSNAAANPKKVPGKKKEPEPTPENPR